MFVTSELVVELTIAPCVDTDPSRTLYSLQLMRLIRLNHNLRMR